MARYFHSCVDRAVPARGLPAPVDGRRGGRLRRPGNERPPAAVVGARRGRPCVGPARRDGSGDSAAAARRPASRRPALAITPSWSPGVGDARADCSPAARTWASVGRGPQRGAARRRLAVARRAGRARWTKRSSSSTGCGRASASTTGAGTSRRGRPTCTRTSRTGDRRSTCRPSAQGRGRRPVAGATGCGRWATLSRCPRSDRRLPRRRRGRRPRGRGDPPARRLLVGAGRRCRAWRARACGSRRRSTSTTRDDWHEPTKMYEHAEASCPTTTCASRSSSPPTPASTRSAFAARELERRSSTATWCWPSAIATFIDEVVGAARVLSGARYFCA